MRATEGKLEKNRRGICEKAMESKRKIENTIEIEDPSIINLWMEWARPAFSCAKNRREEKMKEKQRGKTILPLVIHSTTPTVF